jgi:hypothetical protein
MSFRTIVPVFLFLTFGFGYASAQPSAYPNEVRGFEFFGKGRLKGLTLGSSSKDDLKRIFGQACETDCDYDDLWTVRFEYIKADECITIPRDAEELALCPAGEFIGKLSSVQLEPKQALSFIGVSQSKFTKHGGGGSASASNGGPTSSMSFSSFGDEFGLTYRMFSDAKPPMKKADVELVPGDLLNINYQLSQALTDKIFRIEKPK